MARLAALLRARPLVNYPAADARLARPIIDAFMARGARRFSWKPDFGASLSAAATGFCAVVAGIGFLGIISFVLGELGCELLVEGFG